MNMKKGFTLIEIMIVVAIIAILAAVAIPNFLNYRDDAISNSCEANRKQLENAAEAYILKNPDSDKTSLAEAELVTSAKLLKEWPKCKKGGTLTVKKDTTSGAWKAYCDKHAAEPTK